MKKGLKLLLVLLLLCGCSREFNKQADSQYQIYYLSLEENEIFSRNYRPAAEDASGTIKEFIEELSQMPKKAGYLRLLPEDVSVLGYEQKGIVLTLNLTKEYRNMKDTREILTRAGLVRTFVQIPGVERLEIQIEGEPLTNRNGDPVGTLSADSFLENSGREINAYQSASLVLYFSDETGSGLKKETREVYYNTGIPLERVVVEQLIKGPREEGNYQALSSNTKILGITTSDNICYVNLDKGFVDEQMTVQEKVTIYSLVDSLIANCKAQQVQISINGKTNRVFKESMELSKLFEWDSSLLEVKPDE